MFKHTIIVLKYKGLNSTQCKRCNKYCYMRATSFCNISYQGNRFSSRQISIISLFTFLAVLKHEWPQLFMQKFEGNNINFVIFFIKKTIKIAIKNGGKYTNGLKIRKLRQINDCEVYVTFDCVFIYSWTFFIFILHLVWLPRALFLT